MKTITDLCYGLTWFGVLAFYGSCLAWMFGCPGAFEVAILSGLSALITYTLTRF